MTTIARVIPAADDVVPLRITPGGIDRLLELLGDRSRPLVKYRQGKLLLVSPGMDHERTARRLDLLLTLVCATLRIGLRGYESTLFRKPGLDHAVEPDKSYYVQNARAVSRVRGQIDLTIFPPPDLVVEVLISNGATLALEVYRELGVPEVWLLDMNEGRMTFLHLRRGGTYVERPKSRAFPFLRADDLNPWLEESEDDDTAESARIRRWARLTLVPRRKSNGEA